MFPFSVPATVTDGACTSRKVVSWVLLVGDDVASATFQLIFVVVAPFTETFICDARGVVTVTVRFILL